MEQKQKQYLQQKENKKFQKIFRIFLLIFIISMNIEAKLIIAVPTIPDKVDNLKIHSVSEYVIFDDLLRPLIKYDSNGEIASDLAQSWEIKNDYKEYIFTLKKNQYFSDMSEITVKDVVRSFQDLMNQPDIIHGDGSKLKRINQLDESRFLIEITESNPFFLTEISAPEFRITKSNEKDYNVTSGPYFINNKSSNKISMELNKLYPFSTDVKNKFIDYISYDQNVKTTVKSLEDVDIIWPKSSFSQEEINSFLSNGFYKHELNLGFSYWLSLNPKLLSIEERLQIKEILDNNLKKSDFFKNNSLTRSKQLFLPYGPGRLNDLEIIDIENKLKLNKLTKLKKLDILLPKNIQEELFLILKNQFIDSKFHYYKDFTEYNKLIKKNKYGIALVNNDLSSIDLRSSLIVTFNKSRPLVWLEEKSENYDEILKSITTTLDSTKRYASIKTLGSKLLSDVVIYPLYYKYGFILVKKGIDLSLLNKSGAETSSWKIK